MLSLFVEDQNTAIGRRNIHLLKQGYSLSIGGGKSDFLIFLVPLPPAIAEIRYNGRSCDLIPRKPQYFPDLGSSELANCIGETVRVVSDKRYELRFRFELYEDPLQALNRLLTSVGSAEKSGGPAPAATTGDSDSPRRRPPAPPVNGGRLL
jgi:hypothetical protein